MTRMVDSSANNGQQRNFASTTEELGAARRCGRATHRHGCTVAAAGWGAAPPPRVTHLDSSPVSTAFGAYAAYVPPLAAPDSRSAPLGGGGGGSGKSTTTAALVAR